MNPTRVPGSPAFLWSLAVLVAALHLVLGLTATVDKSVTADEIAYVTAGHTYNVRQDFRLQPENGVLPQRWAAIPATAADLSLPAASTEAWQKADVWKYGRAYLFGQPVGAEKLLFEARAMTGLFSAATGLLIFFWSRLWFGWRGAFLSLGLFCFCPSFLAHGPLATSDVTMTFFFLACSGAWWSHLHQPGSARAWLSAVLFGLACVTKYSAVLLPLMALVAAAVWLMAQSKTEGWYRPLRRLGCTLIFHALVAWGVIWAFYAFRYSAFAPELVSGARFYRGDWDWILTDLGWRATVINTLRQARVLPEAFLYGFAFVLQFAQERSAFLNGDYSLTGWFKFFPIAFALKTTVPMLAFTALGFTWLGRRARRAETTRRRPDWARLYQTTPLLVLFVIYWAVSLGSHLNIGQRHLLPVYPVVFIFAGSAAGLVGRRTPFGAALVLGLAAWHVRESLTIRPHYLAYFNSLAGGPANGWQHLVDSSLDWGQDLPGLKRWIDQHGQQEKIYVSYFGLGELVHEGINAQMLPSVPTQPRSPRAATLGPGIYAISATMLQQVYLPVRGPWAAEQERRYRQLQSNAVESALTLSTGRPTTAQDDYAVLRFVRLCHYLRQRKPDAEIGYSILVYRVSASELDRALNAPIAESP